MRDVRPYIPLIVYTFLSLFTRLYRIGVTNSVVWDEVSSGRHAVPTRAEADPN